LAPLAFVVVLGRLGAQLGGNGAEREAGGGDGGVRSTAAAAAAAALSISTSADVDGAGGRFPGVQHVAAGCAGVQRSATAAAADGLECTGWIPSKKNDGSAPSGVEVTTAAASATDGRDGGGGGGTGLRRGREDGGNVGI